MPRHYIRTDMGDFTANVRVVLFRGAEIGRAEDVPGAMALVQSHARRNGIALPSYDDYSIETYNVRKVAVTLAEQPEWRGSETG